MGGVYHQPDIIFFYKMLHLFFVHAPCKDRNILKMLDQAFPIISRHAHKTSYRMCGCVFRQRPSLSRTCKDQDCGIHSVCIHILSPYIY